MQYSTYGRGETTQNEGADRQRCRAGGNRGAGGANAGRPGYGVHQKAGGMGKGGVGHIRQGKRHRAVGRGFCAAAIAPIGGVQRKIPASTAPRTGQRRRQEKQNQRRRRSPGKYRAHEQNRQPADRQGYAAGFFRSVRQEGAAVETVLVSGAAGSGGRDASDDSCGGDSVAAVPTVVVSAAAVVSSGAAPVRGQADSGGDLPPP